MSLSLLFWLYESHPSFFDSSSLPFSVASGSNFTQQLWDCSTHQISKVSCENGERSNLQLKAEISLRTWQRRKTELHNLKQLIMLWLLKVWLSMCLLKSSLYHHERWRVIFKAQLAVFLLRGNPALQEQLQGKGGKDSHLHPVLWSFLAEWFCHFG